MIEIVETTTSELVEQFVAAQAALRPAELVTQDDQTVRQLLTGTHLLSDELAVRGFVAHRDGELVGRIATTVSAAAPGMTQVGFFECIDDQAVADALFAVADGPLVGPVDASFWLGYRLRTEGFDRAPFVGEPLNPAHHVRLFEGAGFVPAHTYISRIYRPKGRVDVSLFQGLREQFERAGYEFRVPTAETFDDELRVVHGLISELYADFPMYQPIDADDFMTLFAPMKAIVAPEHVTVAYHHGSPAGFQVTVPDVLHTERPRFISLYSGAQRAHKGLGKALLMDFVRFCLENDADAIGALVAEGKVTGSYAPELVVSSSTHVLYQRP